MQSWRPGRAVLICALLAGCATTKTQDPTPVGSIAKPVPFRPNRLPDQAVNAQAQWRPAATTGPRPLCDTGLRTSKVTLPAAPCPINIRPTLQP